MPKLILALFMVVYFLPFRLEAAITLKKIEILKKEKNTKVVFHLSDATEKKLFTLSNPERLVIDFTDTRWQSNIINDKKYSHFASKLRYGVRDGKNLRVVFDLKQKLNNIQKQIYYDPKYKIYLYTLTFDNNNIKKKQNSENASNIKKAITKQKTQKIYHAIDKGPPIIEPDNLSDISLKNNLPIIVIDPGHGGDDPGAQGKYVGIQEKNITLQYAKELYNHLKGRYNVVLTRDKDKFVHLNHRSKIGSDIKADLFISMHADSNNDPCMAGLSVYTLAEKASDKESANLADKENKGEIIKDKFDKDAATILEELSKRQKNNLSAEFAAILVQEISKDIIVLPNSHRFANFMVLRSKNVPAVLIELGYLSNQDEERKLGTKYYKQKLIGSISKAIDVFFSNKKMGVSAR